MKRRLATIASVLVLALVGAACGGGDDEGGSGSGGSDLEKIPLSITFQGALSGPYSYLITPSFQGAQIRIDELNADESFPAEITLEQGDTQGDPANAPPVVEKASTNPDTVAIIGPGFSGESAASGDTYDEAGIPFVTPSATATSLGEEGWEYWYRGCGNDAGQGGLAGTYIAESLKPANLFVAHDKSDYGQPLAETVRDTADQGGVEQVGFEGVEAGADDYSSLISAIEAAGAEAFFFGGYDADFGKIVKQARDAGVDIPMMSGDGSLSSTFIDLAGAGADNVTLIAPTNIGGDFVDKYNTEVGGDASSVPIYAGEGYDVASMFGEGIKQAREDGLEDPEEIRTAIKEYLDSLVGGEGSFDGEAKTYAWDETHELSEEVETLFYLYEVNGGEINPLGTAAEALGS
ncbi:MAG: branched-chain amino acid ABC transporter substrate-binding protein [Actinobacteria bacterium]|nr:branched-chain amino acid ABC transporter substrate-binding protein [Actinomycetota bacterium]